MKKLFKKDKIKRKEFYKFENFRLILKSILKNNNFINMTRWNALLKLSLLPLNSNKNRQKKRCIITKRRNISSFKYRFSRIEFLRLIRGGGVLGVRKMS